GLRRLFSVVLGASGRIGERLVRTREVGRLAGSNLLEFLAQMLNLVGVVLGDFTPEGALDFFRRRVSADVQQVVERFGHDDGDYFLNSATLVAAGSSRIWRCSRSFFARFPLPAASVVFAQYGQNFHPLWTGRWQCGHPPPTRWPHDGQAAKSGDTLM